MAGVLDDQPEVVLTGEGQTVLDVLDIAHINIPGRHTSLLAVADHGGDCIRIQEDAKGTFIATGLAGTPVGLLRVSKRTINVLGCTYKARHACTYIFVTTKVIRNELVISVTLLDGATRIVVGSVQVAVDPLEAWLGHRLSNLKRPGNTLVQGIPLGLVDVQNGREGARGTENRGGRGRARQERDGKEGIEHVANEGIYVRSKRMSVAGASQKQKNTKKKGKVG